MTKTDYIIRTLTEQKDCTKLISELTAMVMSMSTVYETDDDTVLGIVCILVKAQLAAHEDTRKKLKDINEVMNKLLGLNLGDLTDEPTN